MSHDFNISKLKKQKPDIRKAFDPGNGAKLKVKQVFKTKKATAEEQKFKAAMAVDDITETYEFYMDHLADYETLLKEEPQRKNLSIAPKKKTPFLEDRNSDKKIVLPRKKPAKELPEIIPSEIPKKQFLQKKVHRFGQLTSD